MGRIILNGIIFDNENYLGRFTEAISTWCLDQQRTVFGIFYSNMFI